MKFILLVAVIAVLIYIPTGGSPLPKEEKSSSLEESDKNEKNSKTEDATKDTSEEVSTKTQKTTSEKGKSKPRANNEEKNKKSVSSTPEPVIEEEENQFYIMVPALKNQVSNFKPPEPFNFKTIPKMPLHPQYVFKQPEIPSIPFTYPMFTSQDNDKPMMMVPETEQEYNNPKMVTKISDDLPMYYIPMSRTRHSFADVDQLREMNQSPFIFPNKETNPWNTYLEHSGYYK